MYYPKLTIDVVDTQGNLSAGRNKAINRCETPYLLMMEDDMEFIPETNLETLLGIVENDNELIGCGGFLQEAKYRNPWYHDWWEFRGSLRAIPSQRLMRVGPNGYVYRPCQLIQNFGVFRTEAMKKFPWDEELPVGEHQSWFYSIRRDWLVGYCEAVKIAHHSDRDNGEYDKYRMRARTMLEVASKKIGLELHTPIKIEPSSERPCIVVIGIGHSNTSITTKQIAKLGWNLGDADVKFAESEAVRKINYRFYEKELVSEDEMEAALDVLPTPWVLKDPRFNATLPHWVKALSKYQPLLVWLQKPLDEVKESFTRRGQDMPLEKLELRYDWCQSHFNNWPWAKVSLTTESIVEAVSIFDLSRGAGATNNVDKPSL